MARVSITEREKKREKIVAKYAEKRRALKAIISDRSATDDERWEAQLKLQALPRNASPVRFAAALRPDGTALGAYIENSGWAGTSCGKQPCAATSLD